MTRKFRKSQPRQPIKNGVYICVPAFPGQYARVESWDRKAKVLILDRRIGPYWSYTLDQVDLLDIYSAAHAIVRDQKSGML